MVTKVAECERSLTYKSDMIQVRPELLLLVLLLLRLVMVDHWCCLGWLVREVKVKKKKSSNNIPPSDGPSK